MLVVSVGSGIVIRASGINKSDYCTLLIAYFAAHIKTPEQHIKKYHFVPNPDKMHI